MGGKTRPPYPREFREEAVACWKRGVNRRSSGGSWVSPVRRCATGSCELISTPASERMA